MKQFNISLSEFVYISRTFQKDRGPIKEIADSFQALLKEVGMPEDQVMFSSLNEKNYIQEGSIEAPVFIPDIVVTWNRLDQAKELISKMKPSIEDPSVTMNTYNLYLSREGGVSLNFKENTTVEELVVIQYEPEEIKEVLYQLWTGREENKQKQNHWVIPIKVFHQLMLIEQRQLPEKLMKTLNKYHIDKTDGNDILAAIGQRNKKCEGFAFANIELDKEETFSTGFAKNQYYFLMRPKLLGGNVHILQNNFELFLKEIGIVNVK